MYSWSVIFNLNEAQDHRNRKVCQSFNWENVACFDNPTIVSAGILVYPLNFEGSGLGLYLTDETLPHTLVFIQILS